MSELRILADGLRFPEGPIWLPDGSVVLVEIAAGQITKVAADGRKTVIARPGGGPNGIAMGPGGQIYCCNNAVRVLYDRCGDHKLKGPNDLIFAPKGSPGEGGFWFTDLGKVRARDRDHGGVYWAAADGSKIVEAAFPIFGGANGVTLSPDGRTLYVAETETGRLWAWDIVGPGLVRKDPWPSSNGGRVLCQFPGYRRLDSIATTAAGNICVAKQVSGEITTVSPTGEIIRVVKMPERMPTNICFGGPGLKTAFITLSLTGKLAAIEWDEPGLVLPFG